MTDNTSPFPMKIAILLITFNRLDTTKQVFEAIKKSQPPRLYIASEGLKSEKPGVSEKVQEVRDFIMNSIDWECEVFTRFRDENPGCKYAVTGAISWFFENEEMGIILEDDCVPNHSFFPFCQDLLQKYKNDERVMMITGTNYLFLNYEMDDSYFFSKYYIIWGWATWKRAWNLYEIEIHDYPKKKSEKQLEWIYSDNLLIKIYYTMFQQAYNNELDAWDIQWWYTCIFQNGLCIVPKYNLISNIGDYGLFATGGTYDEFLRMPTKAIDYHNIIHPQHVVENGVYDRITIERLYGKYRKRNIYKKILPLIRYHFQNLIKRHRINK